MFPVHFCRLRLLHFLLLSLVVVAGGAVAADPPPAELRVLAWPGYADPDVVQAFEQIHKVHVNLTLIGSDELLWKKVQANRGANYDVFAVNTAELQRYIDHGLVQPIDTAKLPNAAHQLPRFRDLKAIPGLMRKGKVYGIPYTYSEMGLIYDRRQFSTPPESISVLWDEHFRRRVIAYNAANHNFSLAAIASGFDSPFRIHQDDWPPLVERLIALRRNVLSFYTLPEESVQLFVNHHAALMFANYGMQQVKLLQAAGADVGYVVPREGALAWLDCWAITQGAKDMQLASAWINYMLEQKVSSLLVNRQGLANTLATAPELDPNAKLFWLEPMEDIERRQSLWQRIVSGDSLNKVLSP